MVKIFFPFSLELKPNQFSGDDLFLFWNSHISGPKTHYFNGNDLFSLVFTYFWTEKGWHHEIQPRVPLSLATPLAKPHAL